MRTNARWLLGVGLLAVAFAAWRGGAFVPSPGLGQGGRKSTKAAPSAAAVVGYDYALADNEVVRYIPAPDPEARRKLLRRLGRVQGPDSVPVISLTLVWDGVPHIRSMQSGFPVIPRRLLHVLSDSLQIPLCRLEGIAVAREIGLSGDWVVRSDADLDQCMSYVEGVVRKSGYPGFRVVRTIQKRRTHDMHGVARIPEQSVQIFPPHPEVSPALEQTGTLLMFGQVLSAAIQRPVSIHAEPKDLELAWRDNSRAYLDLGTNISGEMISGLLSDISAAMGVQFTDSEVETTVWKLELNK